MSKSISYVLPDIDFFYALSGRVSHAVGVIIGLSKVAEVEVISEERINNYCTSKDVKYRTFSSSEKPTVFKRFSSTLHALLLASKSTKDIVLVRKTFFALLICFFGMPLSFNSKRFFWEVNGLSAEGYRGHFLFGLIYKFALLFNKFIMRNSRGVYVVNEELKKALSSGVFRIPESKIIVVVNGGPEPKYLTKSEVNNGVNFVFFGVFQRYNNFQLVIEAFSAVYEKFDKEANLHIVGRGVLAEEIGELVGKSDKIYLHDAMSHDELSDASFLDSNCVGLIPLVDYYTSQILSPIKLFDYMSLGMPVLISSNVNLSGYSIEPEALFTYESDDIISLSSTLLSIVNENRNWLSVNKKAYDSALENTWDNKMRLLYDFMK